MYYSKVQWQWLLNRLCIVVFTIYQAMHIHRCLSFDWSSKKTMLCVSVFIISNFFTGVLITRYNGYVEPWSYHPIRYVCNSSKGFIYRNFSSQLSTPNMPTIYVISPTYSRHTQKVDLTSVCMTFMHVPKLVWIIIEDSYYKTELVTSVLERCKVESVHLNYRTSEDYRIKSWLWSLFTFSAKGVEQRNTGLEWLRGHCSPHNCTGVVYFGDDDNKYDLRVFDEIRKTRNVSVFSVGFAGGLKFEGPVCENGKVIRWHSASKSSRKVPIDMAGFAINLKLILEKTNVWFGMTVKGKQSQTGQLETDLLEHFTTRDQVECRGSNSEVYAWHTKTEEPNLKHEWHVKSNSDTEYR